MQKPGTQTVGNIEAPPTEPTQENVRPMDDAPEIEGDVSPDEDIPTFSPLLSTSGVQPAKEKTSSDEDAMPLNKLARKIGREKKRPQKTKNSN